jgi:hypothetical protein
MGESASHDNDGPGAAGLHGWSRHLCDDDGTNHVYRVGLLQVGDPRAQQLVRSSDDRVVNDEPWCTCLR